MSITIIGNDVHDIRHKLGMNAPYADIRIRFPSKDYNREPVLGIIVDATMKEGELVPRFFKTPVEATRYISGILKLRDKYVKSEIKKLAKELKKDSKK